MPTIEALIERLAPMIAEEEIVALKEIIDAKDAELSAFKREVSDAVEDVKDAYGLPTGCLSRFILPKPVDPLVEAMNESLVRLCVFDAEEAQKLRDALASRGLKLVEVGDAD